MAFTFPQENTNYARLCRLLVDVGGTVLCDTFDSKHPPANLQKVLSSRSVLPTLQSLRRKRILNPLQWKKLFPDDTSNVSSANFDVSLLMVLLRNICELNPPVSTGNWDQLPPDSDNSIEANIVRIKYYRDEVYSHTSEASVDDPTFNALWQKISSAILALGSGTNYSAMYETVVKGLATAEWMDPAAAAHYVKLLSDWKKDDDSLKEIPEELKEKQQESSIELGEIKEVMKQLPPYERRVKVSVKDEQDSEMAFASTQENTNYARLCRLLVDVGGTVLCDTFDSKHRPANLTKVLSSWSVLPTLQSLRQKRILSPLQWKKLFPDGTSNVSSANFDVLLLMVLLRNICELNPPVSTGNWDQLPPDSDNSIEANIVRIKCYRDEVYSHTSEASVDDPTFNALWQKISSAILALGSGTNYSAMYETVIKGLATAEWMDPAAAAHYVKLLSDWKKDDDSLKEIPEELKDSRMASPDPAAFASTQENTNYARLCRLLVDVGCTVLRDTFNSIHPPANLHVVLLDPNVLPTLQSLRKKRILNPLQWGKLFPAVASSVSSANFDVTILMVLLRNICGLSPPVSTHSWDKLPPDSDNSTEANIVRIKCYRNDVYGHATKASVDDATFNELWQKISIAILALGSGYGTVISRLKTECMDPSTEAHHQKLLSDWKKDDHVLKEMLERIHDNAEEIKEKQKKASNELEEMKGNQETANEQLVKIEDLFVLEKYISIIRQLYKDREGWLVPFPWREEFRFNLDNIFTRLKFVSRRKERGVKTDDSVDMFEIFQPHKECSQPRRVLIEGQPGMGKTAYCHKIALNWAKERKNGESFPDVLLVLLLKCKDINCGLWEAIDDQLLPRGISKEEKERFFTLIKDHQSKVLLVLDGLDELPSSQLSTYKEIIQGRVLPESYLVVTARHKAGLTVPECCHTLLEVEGFTNTDAKQFIQRYFRGHEEDLAEKLLDKLHSDKTLQDLTTNPLNAALLCLLWEDFRGKLPESRTLLYLEIVECVLRRYRLKMELRETDQDLVTLYKDELMQLGRIAMEGLLNDSMYFDQSAFQGFSSDLKSGLGFLTVEVGQSKRRPGLRYGFLHKTFQEFFAALYYCGQLLDKQISFDSFIDDYRYISEFQQVLMFTSGMLAQKCKAAVKALITSVATQVNLRKMDVEVAFACIHECKRKESTLGKEMAQFFGSRLQLRHANCTSCNSELAAVCIETMKSNSTVKRLYLNDDFIDYASAAALAELLKENSTLTKLRLTLNKIGDVYAEALAEGLKENSTLTFLDLSDNTIGKVGADALAKGLKENSTLTILHLSNNALGEVGARALAKGLKKNSALKVLNLAKNAIGEVGADALAKGLIENSALEVLDLPNNAIGEGGADALAKGLKENSTLKELNLSNNAIGEGGADALAKGLKEDSTLERLDLSDNPIGKVSAEALAERLKENSTLKGLNLSNSAIGEVGAVTLAKALEENSVLTELDLSNNAIGNVGAHALAELLKENSTLTYLQLSNNAISEVGAVTLAKALEENSVLTELDLSNNAIGNVGADAQAKPLKHNSTLRFLSLSNNPIGEGTACVVL